MGFFSWKCKRCDHSLLSPYSADGINAWMKEVVVLEKDGSLLRGKYDGYGRVNDREIAWDEDPECYHLACWKLSGSPINYTEGSDNAEDQGYFFDHEHDIPEPQEGIPEPHSLTTNPNLPPHA